MIGEDARKCQTRLSVAVERGQLAKDACDAAGVFVPIIEFPQPVVSTDVGSSGQPGFEIIPNHESLPELGEVVVRGPRLEPGVDPLQFAQRPGQDGLGFLRLGEVRQTHARRSIADRPADVHSVAHSIVLQPASEIPGQIRGSVKGWDDLSNELGVVPWTLG